jgi:hypothetical protein
MYRDFSCKRAVISGYDLDRGKDLKCGFDTLLSPRCSRHPPLSRPLFSLRHRRRLTVFHPAGPTPSPCARRAKPGSATRHLSRRPLLMSLIPVIWTGVATRAAQWLSGTDATTATAEASSHPPAAGPQLSGLQDQPPPRRAAGYSVVHARIDSTARYRFVRAIQLTISISSVCLRLCAKWTCPYSNNGSQERFTSHISSSKKTPRQLRWLLSA